jgi:hypothetical protein
MIMMLYKLHYWSEKTHHVFSTQFGKWSRSCTKFYVNMIVSILRTCILYKLSYNIKYVYFPKFEKWKLVYPSLDWIASHFYVWSNLHDLYISNPRCNKNLVAIFSCRSILKFLKVFLQERADVDTFRVLI